MSLEDLTGATKYLSALNPANPDPLDAKSQGDDHIRGIKNVLLNTFGAVAAPVPVSNAAIKNLNETITGQWTFTGAAKFQSSVTTLEGGTSATSLALVNTTPAVGKDWRVASQNDGDLAIYDQTSGRFVCEFKTDGSMTVPNRALAQQRAGWQPVQIAGGTRTINAADCWNIIFQDTNSATLTLADVGSVGDHIEVVNNTATNMQLVQGTSFLYWLKGGSYSAGNRVIAPFSVITLAKSKPNEWQMWGNGIS